MMLTGSCRGQRTGALHRHLPITAWFILLSLGFVTTNITGTAFLWTEILVLGFLFYSVNRLWERFRKSQFFFHMLWNQHGMPNNFQTNKRLSKEGAIRAEFKHGLMIVTWGFLVLLLSLCVAGSVRPGEALLGQEMGIWVFSATCGTSKNYGEVVNNIGTGDR